MKFDHFLKLIQHKLVVITIVMIYTHTKKEKEKQKPNAYLIIFFFPKI